MLQEYKLEKTMLVVDDDVINCKYHEVLSESLGYQNIISAHNGLEAVGAFVQNLEFIDVILMDVNMPKMGGVDALRLIRSLRNNVPVIFITGSDISELRTVISCEFSDVFVLRKPLSLSQLSDALQVMMPHFPRSLGVVPDFSLLFDPILSMIPEAQGEYY